MSIPGSDGSILERARQIFHAAIDLPREEREPFVQQRCGDDRDLRSEVDSLLASFERAGSFLEGSVLDPTGAFWIGRRIGDYEILRLLGRGGVGLVFEARQDRPRRIVALKLLRPELADAGVRRRFEIEAELLGALTHEGIARIYAAGTVETELGPQAFLAMERIEGRSLLEHAEVGKLSVRERVALIERTCAAVQHAHERGVIHRDLKPGNILVERSGQPKVLDFGVARAIQADLDVESVYTQAGQLIGTIAYMSPEQARGESERLDVRTDIYSLGVVLYQLLAGRLPLQVSNKSLPEAIRSLSEDEPTPLTEAVAEIPIDLATIVGKAIEREPERRYAAVADLAADLRRFLADKPIRARPPSTLYHVRKFTRRNRFLVGGLALAFLLLVAGFVEKTLGERREQRLRLRAEHLQREAESALEQSNFDAYAANLAVAEAALVAADVVNARARLDLASPGLRGWEWTHLRLRLDQSEPVIDNGTGIESMGLSADGNTVVTGGTNCSACAWDLRTGALLWTRSLGGSFTVRGLAVDPKGGLVAAARGSWFAGRGNYGPVTLLSLEDGEVLGELDGHSDVVQAFAFHPSQPLLASASSDGTVRLWDTRTRRELGVVAEHGLDAYDVAFSPDGRLIASAGWDGRAHVIDTAKREIVQTFEAEGRRLHCVEWSPDGQSIVAGTWQGRLLLFERASGGSLHLEGRHTRTVHCVGFTPDGGSIVSAGADGTLRVHSLPLGTTTATFLGSRGVISAFVREAQRNTLLSGGLDGQVRRWSARTRDVPMLERHEAWVYDIAVTADGGTLASAGPTAKGARPGWAHVKLYDLETGVPRRVLQIEGESMVWSCEAAPNSPRIVTAGTDTGAIVWDVLSGEPLVTLSHEAALRCAVFDPSGDRIATTCLDRRVRIWDSRTGDLVLPPIDWDDRRPFGARFSPDGSRLAVTYYGGGVALWDARSGALVAGREGQHVSDVYVARFSPDGETLVTGGRDKRIQRWNADTLLPIGPPHLNPFRVLDVDFAPDGSRLFVGGESGLMRVFETTGWREVASLRGHRGSLRAIAHDATGRFVFTGGSDGEVRAWDGGSAEQRLVDRLFGELLLADDVIAAIGTTERLEPSARARASALAEQRRLDASELRALAWTAALDPGWRPRERAAAVRRARAFQRAQPDDADAWVTLGAVLYRAGELEEARSALARAAAMRENDPWDSAFLVLTLAGLGELEQAREELARLRGLLADDEHASPDASLLQILAEATRTVAAFPQVRSSSR